MHVHVSNVQPFGGFAAENATAPGVIPILVRDNLTSDDPRFHVFTEQLSNFFLHEFGLPSDMVWQFLVVLHADATADVYMNEFLVSLEFLSKSAIKAGAPVMFHDIADIRRVKFPEAGIKDTDRVIYCFKVYWGFGLFFDLSAGHKKAGRASTLDIDRMERSIGDLRRSLMFYHVYEVLEATPTYAEMVKDGWFPFVELLSGDYAALGALYKDKFDFENRKNKIIDGITSARVKQFTQKWWTNPVFASKRSLLEAGINAYLQHTQDGVINCIKNLWTEIEGVLRKIHHEETGKGSKVKSPDLMNHIIEKAKKKAGGDDSLLFPLPFLQYLKDVVFTNFDVETDDVDMSRNTSSHGVAAPEQYTKERALQLILILDQIYFYS